MAENTKKYYGFEIISGIINGLVVFGGDYFSQKGLSLYQIAIFAVLPTIIIYGTLILINKKYGFKKENIGHLILYGFITSLINLTQFGAVILGTPVAVVCFLLYTQPIWTILFERLFFKEKITKVRLIACVIVVIGILFLVNPWDLHAVGSISGILVALFGGLVLSGWVIQGGNLVARNNNPINTSFSGSLFSVVFILLSLPLMKQFTSDPSLTNLSVDFPIELWGLMLLYGIITQTISPILYLEGVKKVPVVDAGIILLLEPVCGAFLAYIFFGQPITWSILVGAGFILVANYFIIKYDKPEKVS